MADDDSLCVILLCLLFCELVFAGTALLLCELFHPLFLFAYLPQRSAVPQDSQNVCASVHASQFMGELRASQFMGEITSLP